MQRAPAGAPTLAAQSGGVTGANAGALLPGTRNLCFYDGALEVIPDQERVSVVAGASQEIGDF
ncbi:MAG TPA: hypothetical protein VLG14_03220, partial [Sphingomonas sp.]|nr:hypothetical protein [Sphingomonas sp.]